LLLAIVDTEKESTRCLVWKGSGTYGDSGSYIHVSPRSLAGISLSFYHGEIFNIAGCIM
jgi:hypothetical protein